MDAADLVPVRPDLSDGVVRLRAHSAADLPEILRQCQDPEMRRWTTVPVPYEREHAQGFVDQVGPCWRRGESYIFAIEHRGAFAGSVDLRRKGDGAAEVGYGLGPWARGRGVMTAALKLVLPWGFEALDLEVVHWRAQVGNWASRRAAWSVGFRHDGLVRGLLPRGAGPGRADEPRRYDGWVASLRRGEAMEPRSNWFRPPRLRAGDAVLRPLRPDDAERMAQACDDPLSQYWLPDLPSPYTLDAAHARLPEVEEGHALGRTIVWAVADGRTDALLGEVSLFGLGKAARRAEVGYWAHPGARGRGIMTGAVDAVAEYALKPVADGGLGLAGVLLRAAEGNKGSCGIAARAGFRLVGRDGRAERLRDGTVLDLLRFERLAPAAESS